MALKNNFKGGREGSSKEESEISFELLSVLKEEARTAEGECSESLVIVEQEVPQLHLKQVALKE